MRGVLLDLDDTLLDDRHATEQGFIAFLEAHSLAAVGPELVAAQARWRAALERNWKRFESGELTFQDQRRYRVRDFLGAKLDDAAADASFRSYEHGYESAWRLKDGVLDFFEKTKGVPKVIVTNGEREQQLRKIRATGLDAHIVDAVTPEDCGYWKPNEGIFLAALALIDREPIECLMIGDSHEKDIQPATQLGMRCYHIRPGGTLVNAIESA